MELGIKVIWIVERVELSLNQEIPI